MAVRMFHWADYMVFALMLLGSAAIGVYYGFVGRRQQNTEEFLLGGRDLHVIPVALSVQASFISAIFVLGLPVEVYYFGTMYGLILFGYIVAYPITAHIFVPKLHRLNLTSGYEYLERRFSKVVRSISSITFIVMTVLYMAVVLYAPALAFSQVTGLSMLVTIVGTGVICTFYTALGGMKAVVWTDSFQMIIILGGLLALLIQGSIDCGGIGRAIRLATEEKRVNFNNFSGYPTERTTVWTQLLGGCFLTLTLHASNQTLIQRYLSIRKTEDSQKAVYVGLAGSIVYLCLVLLVGVVMYAFYHGCDPLLSQKIQKADQMVPLFMMDVMGHLHGLPGLFTACTFSAALSTVSSGVNALAAVILEDIIKPLHWIVQKKHLSEKASTNISKILALFFGLLTIGIGYCAQFLGDTVVQIALSVFGMAGGPLLGVFIMAMLIPCVNTIGATSGLIVSLIMSFWVGLGAVFSPGPKPLLPLSTENCTASYYPDNSTLLTSMSTSQVPEQITTNIPDIASEQPSLLQPFYNLSYMWYSLFAVFVAITVAVPISLLTGSNKDRKIDPSLVYSLKECCPCHRDTGDEENFKLENKQRKSADRITAHDNSTYSPDITPI